MSTIPTYSQPHLAPGLLWLMRGLALVAAGISAYLLIVSLQNDQPAGCGAGSGCSEVLTSKWGKVLGIPVSVPALTGYIAMLAGLALIGPRSSPGTQRLGWSLLVALSAAVIAAAVWFVVLQLAVLQAVCPWCMTDHAVGVLLSGLILWQALRSPQMEGENLSAGSPPPQPTLPKGGSQTPAGRLAPVERPAMDSLDDIDDADDDDPESIMRPRRAVAICLAGMGVALAGMLMAVQIALPSAGPPVKRQAEGRNLDTGPGPGRRIVVLDGALEVSPHDVPVLGSPDAPKLVVVLLDYCCLHCRATHGYLLEALDRYPGQLAIVALPMPLDAKCNPAVDETEPRFEHSGEIARLALAAWRADRTKYAELDRWLFEPDEPRSPDEVRAKASTLVTPAAFEAALKAPWVEQQLKRHIDAYAASRADRIPVVTAPGIPRIEGRPESAEALFGILERELGLAPVTPIP